MTVAETIELLRRFPQDAEIGEGRRLTVFTKQPYGGRVWWFVEAPVLPDWSKPDAQEVYKRATMK